MQTKTVVVALAFIAATGAGVAQSPSWQAKMESERRDAAAGNVSVFTVTPRSGLDSSWVPGVHVFYNAPQPFCYAYVFPGDSTPLRSKPGVRSNDSSAIAGVTFLPPRSIGGAEGATLIERARNIAVRQHERSLRQTLGAVEVVPFESSRPGTWLLKAAPIALPNGQRANFPLHVMLELSPHTVAEINVHGTEDDAAVARRIIESIRTTTDAGCYFADLERLFKAIEVAKPDAPTATELAYTLAARQAKSDLGNPAYQRWYQNQMRPAFNRFFGDALNQCAARSESNVARAVGLVFSVDASGAVNGVTWRENTHFNQCLEPLIRQQRFPATPQDVFHFGVESNP